MAKNYQLIHKLNKWRPSSIRTTSLKSVEDDFTSSLSSPPSITVTYVGTCLTSRESVTVKLTDLDELTDFNVILNEILMTRSLRHVNILPLLTCFADESESGNGQLWRVYPHIYFGSCRDILDWIEAYYSPLTCQEGDEVDEDSLVDRADEQKRLCFNEQSLQPITKSLLAALDYLHSRHVIHRRVEPGSIFLANNGHVYLGCLDSAVSLLSSDGLLRRLHDFPHEQLALDYTAPEILQQNLIGYNTKSDIYSLGVTLCELANGVNPFIGCEKAQMLYEKLAGYDVGLWDRSILTPERKKGQLVCLIENPKVIASVQRRYFSDKFRNFVDLCVQRSSVYRPSAAELLTSHAYMKKMKLQTCLSTFQMSIVADGIVDLQTKCLQRQQAKKSQQQKQQQQNEQSINNSANNVNNNHNTTNNNTTSTNSISWNF